MNENNPALASDSVGVRGDRRHSFAHETTQELRLFRG